MRKCECGRIPRVKRVVKKRKNCSKLDSFYLVICACGIQTPEMSSEEVAKRVWDRM